MLFRSAGVEVDTGLGTNPGPLSLVDVDGDTHLDAVVGNRGASNATILLGNGDGAFQAPRQFAVGAYVTPLGDITPRLPIGRCAV